MFLKLVIFQMGPKNRFYEETVSEVTRQVAPRTHTVVALIFMGAI